MIREDGRGITLLEMLLLIAIIAVLGGIALPLYRADQAAAELTLARTVTAEAVRRAQMLAEAAESDGNWGVKLQTGSVTVFRGASYALRDPALDQITEVSAGVSFGGLPEIVFSKFSGLPQTTGAVTLTSAANTTSTLTINGYGLVSY